MELLRVMVVRLGKLFWCLVKVVVEMMMVLVCLR